MTVDVWHVQWVGPGGFGMNAVVIAETAEVALAECQLLTDDEDIAVVKVGVCTNGTTETTMLAKESL